MRPACFARALRANGAVPIIGHIPTLAPIEVERTGTETKLTVRGTLDSNTAPELSREVQAIVAGQPGHGRRRPPGRSRNIDSSGVAVWIKLHKDMAAGGGKVTLVGLRDQPRAIFKLLRMDKRPAVRPCGAPRPTTCTWSAPGILHATGDST